MGLQKESFAELAVEAFDLEPIRQYCKRRLPVPQTRELSLLKLVQEHKMRMHELASCLYNEQQKTKALKKQVDSLLDSKTSLEARIDALEIRCQKCFD